MSNISKTCYHCNAYWSEDTPGFDDCLRGRVNVERCVDNPDDIIEVGERCIACEREEK
jgi:hypothetical protein